MTEQHDQLLHAQRRARRPPSSERLSRSRADRRLGGVLGGMARFVNAKPRTLRVLFALSVPLSMGLSALSYPIFWFLIPSEKED